MASLEPGQRFGGYEVVAKLGEGGMGEVYRARDPRLGRDVAIKLLPTSLTADQDALARFEREARALASLSHPNVATIYGIDDTGGVRAIVMELVEGETLAARVARGPVPIAQALAMAAQIAQALDAAHERGIVHRDLKPANVTITPKGVVKVLDFGLAKAAPPANSAMTAAPTSALDATQAGVILGTVPYMSPEQARGLPVDKRTDIWAFGCVLFEMLTGRRAFDGTSLADTMVAILDREPAWDLLPAATPSQVRELLRRCLDKDLNARLRDIGDVRLEAENPRPPISRRITRPWIGAAVAIVVFAIAAGLGRSYFKAGTASTPAQIRSVAVLPLADLSAGADEEYFANGMTEELIAALAKIKAWRVISRTSVMQYKGATRSLTAIAKELGVDALVEGTVRRSNDRVRVNVRLVSAGSEEADLWTQSYDRELRDLLDVEADVARAIAAQIKLTLTPGEQGRLAKRRPVDPDVLRLYLKGKAEADKGTEEGIGAGIALFQQALDKDPSFAQAHAAMAIAYGNLNPSYRAPKDVMPKSRDYALKAIALDDTLSEAHTALASVMFRYDWDWAGAEREITHAIELNPNSADARELYGNYLVAVEKQKEAVAELTIAHELNPSGLPTYSSLLAAYVTGGQYDEAIAESRRALAAHPDSAFALGWLGMAYTLKGDLAQALPALKRARELDDNVTTTHFLAMAEAAAGNRAEAERLTHALETAANNRYTCAYEVASVHLRLGNTQKAWEWLNRGLAEQCDCMVWLTTEPWMDPLRVDPRYKDLVRRIGFPGAH